MKLSSIQCIFFSLHCYLYIKLVEKITHHFQPYILTACTQGQEREKPQKIFPMVLLTTTWLYSIPNSTSFEHEDMKMVLPGASKWGSISGTGVRASFQPHWLKVQDGWASQLLYPLAGGLSSHIIPSCLLLSSGCLVKPLVSCWSKLSPTPNLPFLTQFNFNHT